MCKKFKKIHENGFLQLFGNLALPGTQKPNRAQKCPKNDRRKLKLALGKPSFKKKRNFMKKFHKTVTPPPRTAFMKSLFRTLTVFMSTFTVLNKRYEIRLTSPPRL